jgi:hypothetical protein
VSWRACNQGLEPTRYPARLMPAVDMTAAVKSWLALWSDLFSPVYICHRRRRSQSETTVDPADIRGLVPPDVRPSGVGLALGPRVSCRRFTPSRVTPHRSRASTDGRLKTFFSRCQAVDGLWLWSHGYLLGNGPHEGHQFPSDGHHDLMGMFSAGDESSIALAPPHLGLPTDSLDRFGELCQTALEMTADLGRIAVGPGAFNQRPAGMGIARLGNAALATTLTTGICRRRQPQITHEVSGDIESGEVAEFCDGGHGYGALDATQALEGVDHRSESPG